MKKRFSLINIFCILLFVSLTYECTKSNKYYSKNFLCDTYINYFGDSISKVYYLELVDTLIQQEKFKILTINNDREGLIRIDRDTIWYYNNFHKEDRIVLFSFNFKEKSEWKIKNNPFSSKATLDKIENDNFFVSFSKEINISHSLYIKELVFNRTEIIKFRLNLSNFKGEKNWCIPCNTAESQYEK